jgi:hypothetical protein
MLRRANASICSQPFSDGLSVVLPKHYEVKSPPSSRRAFPVRWRGAAPPDFFSETADVGGSESGGLFLILIVLSAVKSKWIDELALLIRRGQNLCSRITSVNDEAGSV